MITIEQIRAARALLGWSQKDLADHAGLSQTGIARIENNSHLPTTQTLGKIVSAFDLAGIEFLGERGLQKKTNDIVSLKGREGFIAFMDDVYQTMAAVGGEMCVYNVDEKNWIKWMGRERYDEHAEMMKGITKKLASRIIIRENDWFFIAHEFAEYRWFPAELFNEQSFYAYGRKLALISFSENDVRVTILDNPDFAGGFRVLFDIAWDHVARVPVKNGAKP